MYLNDNAFLQGGKYKIVRHISSGGFGNTYEGVHTMMDTRVAIKEFFPKMFCNRDENTYHITVATQSNRELVDKLRKKFNEEAKAIFQMKHEHIVRVLDIFEENGTAYYVMDYIDGKSLGDIIKQRGALPEVEAVGYIRQVADALKYVHSLNRLHLDIKPGNIMVETNGHAMLIDFGASKHYDMESGENTSTLMGVNTKGYAPIEQSTQSFTNFSPATDIYALGATLYKLLTGITPPDANLLLAGEESLQPLPPKISENTRKAVTAAMTLKRADRTQTVDVFLSSLDLKTADLWDDEATVCEKEENTRQAKEAHYTSAEQKCREEEAYKASEYEARQKKEEQNRKEEEKARKETKKNKTTIIAISVILTASVCIGGFFVYNQKRTEPEPVLMANSEDLPEILEYATTHVTGETFKDANGKDFTYTGEVVDGQPDGKGTGIYSYGTYTGEYKSGYRQGYGKFESKDGSNKYEGTFANDKYGIGRLTMSDGYYFEGKFKAGQPYNGKWYSKSGKLDTELVNGSEK